MKYNIGFTLGDVFGDGHELYTTYHLRSNYSVEEIHEAYERACDLLGFNLTKDTCHYAENRVIPENYTKQLVKYGILNAQDGEYEVDGPDEFVHIYFDIVTSQLPDLIIEERDLKEEYLGDLMGAGYGTYYL